MRRRQFLITLVGGAAAAPLAISLVACDGTVGQYPPEAGGGGYGGGGNGSGTGTGDDEADSFDVANTDNSGHSHAFTIQCEHEFESGWTYTASGGHTHQVTLSEEDIAAIFNGEQVTIQTTDGHPHTWIIRKPVGACPA